MPTLQIDGQDVCEIKPEVAEYLKSSKDWVFSPNSDHVTEEVVEMGQKPGRFARVESEASLKLEFQLDQVGTTTLII